MFHRSKETGKIIYIKLQKFRSVKKSFSAVDERERKLTLTMGSQCSLYVKMQGSVVERIKPTNEGEGVCDADQEMPK